MERHEILTECVSDAHVYEKSGSLIEYDIINFRKYHAILRKRVQLVETCGVWMK